MRLSYVIVGSLMAIGAYYWYNYVLWNSNIFLAFSPDIISRPQFIPLVVGIIGIIIFIIGLTKEEENVNMHYQTTYPY